MKNEALANGKSLEVGTRSAAQFRSEAEPQLPEIAFSLFHPTGFVIRSGAPEKICFIAISNVCRFMFSLRGKIFRLLTFASQRHEWNYFLLKVPLNGPPNRYLRLHSLVLHLVYRANWKICFRRTVIDTCCTFSLSRFVALCRTNDVESNLSSFPSFIEVEAKSLRNIFLVVSEKLINGFL